MKKIFLTTIVLSALLVFPLISLAQPETLPKEGGAPTVVTSAAGLIDLIKRVGDWIFLGLLAITAVFLIYAGFLWVTAGGDPNAATKARQMLVNALIGLGVALMARGLVQVMRSIIAG